MNRSLPVLGDDAEAELGAHARVWRQTKRGFLKENNNHTMEQYTQLELVTLCITQACDCGVSYLNEAGLAIAINAAICVILQQEHFVLLFADATKINHTIPTTTTSR